MSKLVTNIRLDPQIKEKALSRAQKEGLTLSEVAKYCFQAYADGKLTIGILELHPGYPDAYAAIIKREAEALKKSRKEGKLKGYVGGEGLLDAMLSE